MGQDAVIPGPLDQHGYRDDDGYMVWFVGGKRQDGVGMTFHVWQRPYH